MKKSDWILSLATLAYSYLFYQQLAGINYFIFSILLCILLAVLNKDVWKDKKWLMYAGLSVASSFFIMWHNSNLAIWANICSLLLLSANSVNRSSSVIMNGFYSMYSIAGSYVFIIINAVKRQETKTGDTPPSGKKGMNFLIGLAVLVIVLIFFFIYKNANPLFEKFTEKINLDFISGAWIVFTLIGFFIVYGLFRHQRITGLDTWESSLPITLNNQGLKIKLFEKKGGVFLFVMLNFMLLFINVLDVVYLYVLNQLPEGITHTQFVHNGVGMIILSIVLGIAIILYLFRNAMNFEEKNKFIKLLVTLWILQNAMMIVSTCLRNYIYVSEFNLTYKRIGVFVYLALSIIGLLLTLYKIQFKKSNWFLVRTNAFCCFLFLCFSSFINWDKLVCEFNIARKAEKLQALDKKYLISLSDESIPYLQALKNKKGFDTDSAKIDEDPGRADLSLISDISSYRINYSTNSSETDAKTYAFLKKIHAHPGWQSWNHRNANVLEQLQALNAKGQLKTFTLNNHELDSMDLLGLFSNLKNVNLSNCRGNKFGFLKNYTKINSLSLSGNNIKQLNEIPKLSSLASLDLSYNPVSSLSGINNFPNVEQLNISNTNVSQLLNIPVSSKIRSLEANGCTYLKDLRGLNNAKQLEYLSLNQAPVIEYFPSLPSLKVLSMSGSYDNTNKNLSLMPVLENVEELSVTGSPNFNVGNLMVYDKKNAINFKRFPKLKTLNASSNELEDLFALSNYKELEILRLENNKIKNTIFMWEYTNLKELNLASNHLEQLNFNEKHNTLSKLALNNNEYLDDFSGLKFLSRLTNLDISATHFSDLNLLTCAGSLQELNIKDCRVSSFDPLIRFKKLEVLHITAIAEKGIAVLKQISSLKELYLGTALSKEELQELRKQLPTIQHIHNGTH
jgi:hypothetical protein